MFMEKRFFCQVYFKSLPKLSTKIIAYPLCVGQFPFLFYFYFYFQYQYVAKRTRQVTKAKKSLELGMPAERASAQRSKWTSEQKCDNWSVLRINATVGKLVYYTSIEQSAAVDDNDHVDDDDDDDDDGDDDDDENDDDDDTDEEDYN